MLFDLQPRDSYASPESDDYTMEWSVVDASVSVEKLQFWVESALQAPMNATPDGSIPDSINDEDFMGQRAPRHRSPKLLRAIRETQQSSPLKFSEIFKFSTYAPRMEVKRILDVPNSAVTVDLSPFIYSMIGDPSVHRFHERVWDFIELVHEKAFLSGLKRDQIQLHMSDRLWATLCASFVRDRFKRKARLSYDINYTDSLEPQDVFLSVTIYYHDGSYTFRINQDSLSIYLEHEKSAARSGKGPGSHLYPDSYPISWHSAQYRETIWPNPIITGSASIPIRIFVHFNISKDSSVPASSIIQNVSATVNEFLSKNEDFSSTHTVHIESFRVGSRNFCIAISIASDTSDRRHEVGTNPYAHALLHDLSATQKSLCGEFNLSASSFRISASASLVAYLCEEYARTAFHHPAAVFWMDIKACNRLPSGKYYETSPDNAVAWWYRISCYEGVYEYDYCGDIEHVDLYEHHIAEHLLRRCINLITSEQCHSASEPHGLLRA
jgi:hypothetical protein